MSKLLLETEFVQQMEQAAIFRDFAVDFPQRQTTISSNYNIATKIQNKLQNKIRNRSFLRSKNQTFSENTVELIVGSDDSDQEANDTQLLPPILDLKEPEFQVDEDDGFIVPVEEEQKIQEKKNLDEEIEDYTEEQFNKALDTEEESEEPKTMSETEFENALNSENELEALVAEKESSESEENFNEQCQDPAILFRKEMDKQDAENLKQVANPILIALQGGEDIDEEVDQEIGRSKTTPKHTNTSSMDRNSNSDDLQELSKASVPKRITNQRPSRFALALHNQNSIIIPIEGSSREESQGFMGSDDFLNNNDYLPEKVEDEKMQRLRNKLRNSIDTSSQNYNSPSSQSYITSKEEIEIQKSKPFSFLSNSSPQDQREKARELAEKNLKRQSTSKLVQHNLIGAQSFRQQHKGLSELSNSKQKSSLSASSSLFFQREGSQGSKGVNSDQKTPARNVKKNTSSITATLLATAGVEEIMDITPKTKGKIVPKKGKK